MDRQQIERWGQDYFSIDSKGYVQTHESSTSACKVRILDVVKHLQERNIKPPYILRFHDILIAQVIKLNKIFQETIKSSKYRGNYFGVFPVKVNQCKDVVEEILDAGAPYNFGIEAGSKAELIAAIATAPPNQGLTLLNGHKDREMMELCCVSSALGRKTVVILEHIRELDTFLEVTAQREHHLPLLGVRIKLSSQAQGRWQNSSGDHSKFGLSAMEILHVIERLKSQKKIHLLKLLHFHVGSQIANIISLKEAMTEATRFYCEVSKMGVPLEFLDVGGGVGIDYTGMSSSEDYSINYTMQDYVQDTVDIVGDLCDHNNVPHPHLVSETGRAVVAHHSCVVTNVIDEISVYQKDLSPPPVEKPHPLVADIIYFAQALTRENYMETYHDIIYKRRECLSAFNIGVLNLQEKALSEWYFWKTCFEILSYGEQNQDENPEIITLREKLFTQFICNLSIFQSALDSWAIDQVLPILPLKQHSQEKKRVVISDLTCDSDGKIKRYAYDGQLYPYLGISCGPEASQEDYYIGIFLTGAYQDTMGDMHNLFGRLNEAHIYFDSSSEDHFHIEKIVHGETIEKILKTFQYNPAQMTENIHHQLEKRRQQGALNSFSTSDYKEIFKNAIQRQSYFLSPKKSDLFKN